MKDKQGTNTVFSKEHYERVKERKKLIKKLKRKKLFSFKKKEVRALSEPERAELMKEQALYCYLLRCHLEERVRYIQSLNMKQAVKNFKLSILNQKSKAAIKIRLQDKNELELYIAEIERQEQRAIEELKKKHEKHIENKNSEEFQKRVDGFETVRLKKIAQRKKDASLGLNEYSFNDEEIENKIKIKKKGYRKSEKLILESMNQANSEIDKLMLSIENAKNLTPAELKKKEQKIAEIAKKIEEFERNQTNISKSFRSPEYNKKGGYQENFENIAKSKFASEIDEVFAASKNIADRQETIAIDDLVYAGNKRKRLQIEKESENKAEPSDDKDK